MQADAVISFPFFKQKPPPWLAMFIHHCQNAGLKHPREAIALWKRTQPQKLGPELVSSSCNSYLWCRPTWPSAHCVGPPKCILGSQTAAGQLSSTQKPCRTTCSRLLPAWTGQIVASNVGMRYLGYLYLTLWSLLSNRTLHSLPLRL